MGHSGCCAWLIDNVVVAILLGVSGWTVPYATGENNCVSNSTDSGYGVVVHVAAVDAGT